MHLPASVKCRIVSTFWAKNGYLSVRSFINILFWFPIGSLTWMSACFGTTRVTYDRVCFLNPHSALAKQWKRPDPVQSAIHRPTGAASQLGGGRSTHRRDISGQMWTSIGPNGSSSAYQSKCLHRNVLKTKRPWKN